MTFVSKHNNKFNGTALTFQLTRITIRLIRRILTSLNHVVLINTKITVFIMYIENICEIFNLFMLIICLIKYRLAKPM